MPNNYHVTMEDEQVADETVIQARSMTEAWSSAIAWGESIYRNDNVGLYEVTFTISQIDAEGDPVAQRSETVVLNDEDEEWVLDQHERPVYRNVRQNPVDGLWYATVWWGDRYVSTIRRQGYHTEEQARDADISDMHAASYREPDPGEPDC